MIRCLLCLKHETSSGKKRLGCGYGSIAAWAGENEKTVAILSLDAVHSSRRFLAIARARSAIIRRVWGTDTAFLREHGDLYHRVLTEQELRAVRALLAQARTAEAREILRAIDKAAATYRVLAALPGPCVRGVMSVRRTVRSAVRGLRARPS